MAAELGWGRGNGKLRARGMSRLLKRENQQTVAEKNFNRWLTTRLPGLRSTRWSPLEEPAENTIGIIKPLIPILRYSY